MCTFDCKKLESANWDNEILGLVSQIHEYKGRQEHYINQQPAELNRLVEIAKVQSTESSNDIEGMYVPGTQGSEIYAESLC